MKKWASLKKRASGFTIVELLIVIVVIGILAAITIVAFNGVQQRARVAALQSDLENSAKTLESYKFTMSTSEQYPVDLAGAALQSSSGTTYSYTVNNTTSPPMYCLTATNSGVNYARSSFSNTSAQGTCAMNLVTNPSFQSNNDGWATGGYGTGGVATSNRTAAIGPSGGYAMRTVWTTAAAGGGHQSNVPTANLEAGKTYAASAWLRTSTASSGAIRVQVGASDIYQGGDTPLPANTWTRVTYVFTVTSSGAGQVAARISNLAGTANGFTFDSTNFMVTQGSTVYGYADGNSAGWSWSAAANNSISAGPAS